MIDDRIAEIRGAIRDVPDFPKKGIIFKDITPLLSDGRLFKLCIDLLVEKIQDRGAEKVVGLDARGFIFGAAVADRLGIGFVPIRKAGKLPSQTIAASYELEYGESTFEMHTDAVSKGEKVVIIDDLLATGGTAAAAQSLLLEVGAEILGSYFIIELSDLNGREKLDEIIIQSLFKI